MKKLLALMALYNILFGTSINMIILPIIDPCICLFMILLHNRLSSLIVRRAGYKVFFLAET